jgi:hypothetical protein
MAATLASATSARWEAGTGMEPSNARVASFPQSWSGLWAVPECSDEDAISDPGRRGGH